MSPEYASFFNEHGYLVTARIKAAFICLINKVIFSKYLWGRTKLQDIILLNPHVNDVITNSHAQIEKKPVCT